MPGFKVNTLGEAAPSSPAPYYKYTWDIQTIFKEDGTRMPLIYAQDASTPTWSFEKEEVLGASLRYKFAKSVGFDDVKISWYDVDGLADIIKKWRQLVWTPEDGLKNPNDYKTDSVLRSLTYDLEGNVAWKLIGSWPSTIKTGDLTYTDSGIKIVEVTVTYDWAEEDITPIS